MNRWVSFAALPAMLLFVDPALAADAAAVQAPPVAGWSGAPGEFAPGFTATADESWSAQAPGTVLASDATSIVVARALRPLAAFASWCPQPRLESIRYRRRYRDREREKEREPERKSSSDDVGGFSQLHGGFFDPDGFPPKSALFGVRAGANLDNSFQLGFQLDWAHRSEKSTTVVTDVPLPGGGSAERQTVLAQSSAHLVPMMAFLQFSPGNDLPISPYVGAGGGYQVLFLNAENFETGEQFEATFDGWGWQAWGGVTMPLSGKTRLAAEVFWNEADLDREIDDPSMPNLREVLPMTGMGMRFGFSWGF